MRKCQQDSPLDAPCVCDGPLCASRQVVNQCAAAASCCNTFKPAYLELADRPPEQVPSDSGVSLGLVLGVGIPVALAAVVLAGFIGYEVGKPGGLP